MSSSTEARFLKYVSMDTQSEEFKKEFPSTKKQLEFARFLAEELKALGIEDARVDQNGYVMASIPSNIEPDTAPAVGFISHMDTSPDAPGANVRPRVIRGYDGGVIPLSSDGTVKLDPEEFPDLLMQKGKDVIVTDGTTLLGADNKSGIAEIMQMAETLVNNPQIPHGKVCIAFTPDEEVGRGTELFDIEAFGADVAYAVDGGPLGSIQYETFNGARALVDFTGVMIHPGYAKGKMVNASELGAEFMRMLPAQAKPEYTEGYDGYYHLMSFTGTVDSAHLDFLVREHDTEKFRSKKAFMHDIADFMNKKYGYEAVRVSISDTYYNTRDKLLPHPEYLELPRRAMELNGVVPVTEAIRGGTDGSILTQRGLPCPALHSGGFNAHSVYEFVSVQDMELIGKTFVTLVQLYAQL